MSEKEERCEIGMPKKHCLIDRLIERDASMYIDGEWVRIRDVFKSSELKEKKEK